MKICLICNIIEDGSLSMQLYKKDLLKHFPKKFKIEVFAPSINKKLFFHKYFLFFYKHFIYPIRVMFIKADVYHVLDHSYGHLVYFLPKKKVVVSCHDLIPLRHSKTTNAFGRFLFKIYINGTIKARKIIAVSKNTKKDLIELGKCDSKKISVIPNGVDESFRILPKKERDEIKNKMNIKKNEKIILVVGSHPYKNVKGSIIAFAKILKKNKNLKLIKIGKFNNDELELIKKIKIGKKIICFDNFKKMFKLYNISDVLSFPSFYEGFGRPILEAMACGCPVVSSNTSSIPEVANNAAILVNPNNNQEIAEAILRIINDKKIRNKLIKKGLKICKKYSWHKIADQITEVYKEIYKENS